MLRWCRDFVRWCARIMWANVEMWRDFAHIIWNGVKCCAHNLSWGGNNVTRCCDDFVMWCDFAPSTVISSFQLANLWAILTSLKLVYQIKATQRITGLISSTSSDFQAYLAPRCRLSQTKICSKLIGATAHRMKCWRVILSWKVVLPRLAWSHFRFAPSSGFRFQFAPSTVKLKHFAPSSVVKCNFAPSSVTISNSAPSSGFDFKFAPSSVNNFKFAPSSVILSQIIKFEINVLPRRTWFWIFSDVMLS